MNNIIQQSNNFNQNSNGVKISCIIPTCDRPEFAVEAVRSVLGQTARPFEIILVNNGRKKPVLPQNLAVYVKIYDIMPYAGAAQARNFGAVAAGGDYLAFLDDDDVWPPEYLSNAARAIEKGARCVLSRLDWVTGGKQEVLKNPHGRVSIANLLVRNPGATGTNMVIEKNLFFEASGFDPKLPPSEDKALILELLLKKVSVTTLPDNVVLVGKDRGETYLSSDLKLAEGAFQFTRKYSHLMNWRQRLYNWSKIYYYRTSGGQRWARPVSVILSIISKIFSPFRNNLK